MSTEAINARAALERQMEIDADRIRAASGIRLTLATEPYLHAKVHVPILHHERNDLAKLADLLDEYIALKSALQTPAALDRMIARLQEARSKL